MTSTSARLKQERSKQLSRDKQRRLSPLRLASLSCLSCVWLATGLPQKPAMSGDVMPPMLVSTIMSPLDTMRPSSPRSVVSEHSPLKKRKITGSVTFDFEHRYASRSGSLALLRVLSGPSSPTVELLTTSLPASPVPKKALGPAFKARPTQTTNRRRQTHSPTRSEHPPSADLVHGQAIDLPAAPPAFTPPSRSKSDSLSSMPSKDEQEPQLPSFPQLTAAKALAGQNASSYLTFIPPSEADDITAWFDPESAASSTLKNELMSLARGQSIVFAYPTQQGAETFAEQVLAPVLDPVLRRAVNEHGLKTESAAAIRKMEAVESLLGANDLEETVQGIVDMANMETTDEQFRVRHSTIASVSLPSDFWRFHWIKQERPRVRKAVEAGLGNGGGAPVEMAGISVPRSPVRVAEELLESVRTQRFGEWEGGERTMAAIEVGLFVLTRN